MSTVLSPVTVEYPSSDGKPMAESDSQRDCLVYAVDALQQHFRHLRDVYVSGNLLLYYEEGNPKAVVAPDVFVVLGASNHRRPSYLLWREPKAPDFVLEVTSRSTRKKDQGPKRELYRRLGVREYWQYDPTGDYLEPALQGLALRGGEYQPLPAVERGAGRLVLRSAVLGLELRLESGEFRFRDAAAGTTLGTREELETRLRVEAAARQREAAARQREAAARRREAAARRAAEARVAELEARLRKQPPRDR